MCKNVFELLDLKDLFDNFGKILRFVIRYEIKF